MHLLAQNLSKFQNKQNSVAYLSVSLSNGRTIWIDTLDRSASLVSVNTGVVIGIFSVIKSKFQPLPIEEVEALLLAHKA